MYTMNDDEHLKSKSTSSSFSLFSFETVGSKYLHNIIPLAWHAPCRTLAMLFINAVITSHFFAASPTQMTIAGSWHLLSFCMFLFFSSALITITFRSPPNDPNWPSRPLPHYAQPLAPGSASHPHQHPQPNFHPAKVAFATFLHPTIISSDPDTKQDSDGERMAEHYSQSVRLRTYQLLYSPPTQSRSSSSSRPRSQSATGSA